MNAGLLRYRLGYSKLGKVRFLGHRDVARMWERTLRRAEVPVAVSTGFTPRARISFGLALPTGAESLIEMLDVLVDASAVAESDEQRLADLWRERIGEALPVGFDLVHLSRIDGGVSLQESVIASSWILLIDHPGASEAVERIRSSDSVPLERERKGERQLDDIRPGILDVSVVDAKSLGPEVEARLGSSAFSGSSTAVSALLTTAGRGIRPTELVEAMFPEHQPWDLLSRVIRTNQWIDKDGQRVDALSDSAARPAVCA